MSEDITITRHIRGRVCDACHGHGDYFYASTATWLGGLGGAAMTKGVCRFCWGSGDAEFPYLNLQKLVADIRANAKVSGAKVLAGAAHVPFNIIRAGAEALADEIEKLAGGRKDRPAGFREMAKVLARELRVVKDAAEKES